MREAKVKFPVSVLKCLNKRNGRKIQLTVFLFCCKGQVYFRFIDINLTKQSMCETYYICITGMKLFLYITNNANLMTQQLL